MPAVKLLSNIPLQLALLDPPEGELDERYEKVHYTTSAGTLTVSYRVAAKINALELRAGESFHICKCEKPEGIQWDVWLASASEQGRSAEETQITPAECVAPGWMVDASRRAWRSDDGACPFCKIENCGHWTGFGWANPKMTPPDVIARAQAVIADNEAIRGVKEMPKRARRANPDQPRLFDKGTGTDGPAPQPRPIPAMPPAKPARVQIPYNVAFREVTKFVTIELKATGEQWNDQAKQDMVSTILIAAAKAGAAAIDLARLVPGVKVDFIHNDRRYSAKIEITEVPPS